MGGRRTARGPPPRPRRYLDAMPKLKLKYCGAKSSVASP